MTTSKKRRRPSPRTVIGPSDIRLIIRGLTFREEKVRQGARAVLTQLAGKDLGTSPQAWEEWFDQNKARFELQLAALKLFDRFRNRILAGDWATAAGLILTDSLPEAIRQDLPGWLRDHRKDLRKAYRDASIEKPQVEDDGCTLVINWGKAGYESRHAKVVPWQDEFRFNLLPLEGRLVEADQA